MTAYPFRSPDRNIPDLCADVTDKLRCFLAEKLQYIRGFRIDIAGSFGNVPVLLAVYCLILGFKPVLVICIRDRRTD